jgi:hypothetical protein
MCSSWLFPDTFAQTYHTTELEIDPADYPGLTHAWFETITGSNEGLSIYLVDDVGILYATITPTLNAQAERKRIEFTLNPAKTKYYLKIEASPDYDVIDLRTARVILDVEDSERARIQIDLVGGDDSSGGYTGDSAENDYWAYATSSSSATYGYGGSGTTDKWFRLFYLDKSKWATVDKWTFEVIGLDGSFALFRKDTGAVIAGSELTFSSTTTPSRQTVDIDNDDLPDLTELELRMKRGASTAYVYRASLYCSLSDVTLMEVHWKVGTVIKGYLGGIGPDIDLDPRYETRARFLFDPTKFGIGTQFYFEATAKEVGTTSSVFLYDVGISDSGLDSYTSNAAVITAVPRFDEEETVDVGVAMIGTWLWPNNSGGVWGNNSKFVYAMSGDPYIIDYIFAPTILLQGTLEAVVMLSDEGAFQTISASGFDFTGKMGGKPIQHVEMQSVVWAHSRDVRVTAPLSPNCNWNIGGTNYPMQVNGYTTMSPVLQAKQQSVSGTWNVASLNGATITIKVQMPAGNNDDTFYLVGWIGLHATAGDTVPLSQLDFSNTARERQRSPDLGGVLIDGNRYIVYTNATGGNSIALHSPYFLICEVVGTAPIAECVSVTAAIDDDTMMVTGAGVGTDATQWQVVRTSDGAVMDSGAGMTPTFSFTGEYAIEYQLQFAGQDDIFSEEGCTFIFTAAPECISVTATINTDTMIVTGTGLGSNATEWRVIRISTGEVMDSGSGLTASFSFVGAYAVRYRLQYSADGGQVWSTTGCMFEFVRPVETICIDLPCVLCIPVAEVTLEPAVMGKLRCDMDLRPEGELTDAMQFKTRINYERRALDLRMLN